MKEKKKLPIEFEEICRIQLEILDNIDMFCKEQNIQYSLAFGTLLGAVRHGGYIPWDDDIDIMMTRKNYNKFRDVYKSEKYPFVDIKTDNRHPVPMGKVYDSRTYFYYKSKIKRKYGIFVDIFPVDNIPTDIKERTTWLKKINRYIALNSIKCNTWSFLFCSNENAFGKLLRCLIKLFISSAFIHRRLESLYVKYDDTDTDYMGPVMIYRYKDYWRVCPKECFQAYSKICFEGKDYMSIKDYDTFLKIRFGEYMKLPPKEERIRKHGIIAYFK